MVGFCAKVYQRLRGRSAARELELRREVELELRESLTAELTAKLYTELLNMRLEEIRPETIKKIDNLIASKSAELINEGESRAIVRLSAAFDQARRTGQPVLLEVAGEVFCVASPALDATHVPTGLN